MYFLFSYVNIRMIITVIVIISILCVCVCVCLCVWYIILEHEDKNARAEQIWRFLIATMKTSIHISQSKFNFHVLRIHHNIHIFDSFDVEHKIET